MSDLIKGFSIVFVGLALMVGFALYVQSKGLI